MTEFERSLVKSINRFFTDQQIRGIAYRRKQHRFSSQFVDILVDSFDPNYYLAIENKSLKEASSGKLYFSQHFSQAKDKHQVERISDFLHRSGRKGYLAVEVRRGRGKPREAYLVPWHHVQDRYHSDEPGFHLDEIRDFKKIQREGATYNIQEALDTE